MAGGTTRRDTPETFLVPRISNPHDDTWNIVELTREKTDDDIEPGSAVS